VKEKKEFLGKRKENYGHESVGTGKGKIMTGVDQGLLKKKKQNKEK